MCYTLFKYKFKSKRSKKMKAKDRKRAIINLLITKKQAITGGELSKTFGVSRQIIVRDISSLKEAGYDIVSTHFGYLLKSPPFAERVFKFYHSSVETADELNTIVSLGGSIADVFVWHKVYGKISVPLNLFSKDAVDKFMENVRSGKSSELMSITGGYHYHTVYADSEEILDNIEKALRAKNYIAPDNDEA